MKKFNQTEQPQPTYNPEKQKTGLLCYIIGMVVILTIYRVLVAVVISLDLFGEIRDYQRYVRGSSTFLLFLMLGLLWLAYRQWRDIIHEHDQLETVLASIGPDMLIAVDRNNRILRCGGAVEEMSGYKPEDLIGQKSGLLYHDQRADGQGHEIQSALNRTGFHVGYVTGRTKDQGDYLLEMQTSRMNNRDSGSVLILRNLDGRQQARVQLQHRIRMEEIFATLSTEFLQAEPDRFGETCLNALRQIAEVFGHEIASVGFFDMQTGSLRDSWTWKQQQDVMTPGIDALLTRAAASIETNTQTTYTFPQDLDKAPPPLAKLHTQEGIRSAVLSPMLLQGRRFGFLSMFSKTQHSQRWATEDTVFLQAITSTFLSGELSTHAAELFPTRPVAQPPEIEIQTVSDAPPEN